MNLPIRMIRRATQRAVQVVIDEYPWRIVWVPRRSIEGGKTLVAGERGIILNVWGRWAKDFSEQEYLRWMEQTRGASP